MKGFDCSICGKTLPTKRGRHLHEKRVHAESESKAAILNEKVSAPKPPTMPPKPVAYSPPEEIVAPETSLDSTAGLVDDPCGFIRLEAESRAESLGHSLGPWVPLGKNTAKSNCVDCRKEAAYALAPPPGGEKVVGAAVNVKCD